MSTLLLTPSTPTTGVRRGASVGATLAGFVILGALAAWLLAPSLMIPPTRMVGWQLQGFPGRVSDTAATSMAIEVDVASWPTPRRSTPLPAPEDRRFDTVGGGRPLRAWRSGSAYCRMG